LARQLKSTQTAHQETFGLASGAKSFHGIVHRDQCGNGVDYHSQYNCRLQGSFSFDLFNFITEFVPSPEFSTRGPMHNIYNSGFSAFFKKKIKA
jgi:hypothetical protein